ncbi:hypothetical protein BJ508DRAFT_418619 [Ascobolus immersus RN42]|uniref:Uncharacterized protein n=1 Tax=Ascobolus immersus RN42 TaxID=1160509 RepID=A0A3N4HL17_ASCIM|nr:hypothetical protein BJ508DRAFT_418619 [Ascobolus immersus RN42]
MPDFFPGGNLGSRNERAQPFTFEFLQLSKHCDRIYFHLTALLCVFRGHIHTATIEYSGTAEEFQCESVYAKNHKAKNGLTHGRCLALFIALTDQLYGRKRYRPELHLDTRIDETTRRVLELRRSSSRAAFLRAWQRDDSDVSSFQQRWDGDKLMRLVISVFVQWSKEMRESMEGAGLALLENDVMKTGRVCCCCLP